MLFDCRILQVNTVLAMLYYSWCHTELKKTVIENRAKQWFVWIVLALVVVEFVLVIGPSVNLRASQMHQRCYYSTDASTAGWLYLWVFPYLLPLVLAAPPMARIAMKLRDASYNMTESQKTQNYVVLSACGGYFFFQLLYYTLTLWYLMAKDKEGFRQALFLCNFCVVFRPARSFGYLLFIHTLTNATDDYKYSPLPSADFDIAEVLVSFSAFIFS